MSYFHSRSGILLFAVALTAWSACAAEGKARLRIDETGQALLDGKPFRGVGVNYFDAFSRRLKNPEDTSYQAGFAELASLGIPFIRFMCGGFYGKDWQHYVSDPERYFRLLDDVVESAAKNGIGLIPSVFWWYPGVPDLVGEPMDQLGNPSSKTHAFFRRYTEELVKRYKEHPAVWAWEFGNEYNLAADLPNAKDCLPPVNPVLGTPTERTERDIVTGAMVLEAMKTFGETVRKIDPDRPITSGHAVPRPTQFHQRTEGAWITDSREEYQQELLRFHPTHFDLVSIHVYPPAGKGYFGPDGCTPEALLDATTSAARAAGKAVFLGEFGAGDAEQQAGAESARSQFESLLKAFEASPIPLAALWVYDFAWQDGTYNITTTNQRRYQLEAIRDLNARLTAAAKTTAPQPPGP